VDAHADLDLVVAQQEGGLARLGDGTPMERVASPAFSVMRTTSSRSLIVADAPPAILMTKMSPAMPRRRCSWPFGAEATSSRMSTVRTRMPSSAAISAAMSKFITSPA
jgi:hypothetical protein